VIDATDDWFGWQMPVAFDENDCPLPPSDETIAASKLLLSNAGAGDRPQL
jgi:hypothetical protein